MQLSTFEGLPIQDASLIRLRFTPQSGDMGESELRIGPDPLGHYSVRGANLSAPGPWQIRMTIQRPDQFDTVVDFTPDVPAMPPPSPPPVLETAQPLPYRLPVLLLTGAVTLALGGFFLGREHFRLRQGAALVAVGLVIIGLAFLVSGVFV